MANPHAKVCSKIPGQDVQFLENKSNLHTVNKKSHSDYTLIVVGELYHCIPLLLDTCIYMRQFAVFNPVNFCTNLDLVSIQYETLSQLSAGYQMELEFSHWVFKGRLNTVLPNDGTCELTIR